MWRRARLSGKLNASSDPHPPTASPCLRDMAMELAAAISICISPDRSEEVIRALFTTGLKLSALDRASVHCSPGDCCIFSTHTLALVCSFRLLWPKLSSFLCDGEGGKEIPQEVPVRKEGRECAQYRASYERWVSTTSTGTAHRRGAGLPASQCCKALERPSRMNLVSM